MNKEGGSIIKGGQQRQDKIDYNQLGNNEEMRKKPTEL